MTDTGGIFGEILEEGTSLVKQTVKQVAKAPTDLAKAAGKQVKGNDQPQSQAQDARIDQKAQTQEFVKDLYKPGEAIPKDKVQTKSEETEEQKLESLRRELHANYYQKLVNPVKAPEEKPAEKVEREKNEERWELREKEKKKPPPLAVQRAAQKAEKFPGASG